MELLRQVKVTLQAEAMTLDRVVTDIERAAGALHTLGRYLDAEQEGMGAETALLLSGFLEQRVRALKALLDQAVPLAE